MDSLSSPLCLQLNDSIIFSVLQFFELFGHHSALITNQDGLPIENMLISDIFQNWWGEFYNNKHIICGSVVHWSLEDIDLYNFFSNNFSIVSNTIYKLDPQIHCLLDRFRRPGMPRYEWVIIGPKGTHVRAHVDMFRTASWNLLLCGQKTWRFWLPDSKPEKNLPDFTFTQSEGDLIWIPEDYWHSVDYDASALCLSKNLIPLRSLSNISKAASGKIPALEPYLLALIEIWSQIDAI
ncbi:MAG: hypothetical protein RSD40_00135 [Bacilli bacterium]